ncbi:hypothetical protein [Brucella sp. IR073]|uniref:hypothetical protein n=1 Tax=unclassified Brucella TaxID=2632610 RepID=UPI003B9815A4
MIGLDSHRVAAVDGLSWQLDLLPSGRPGLKPEISRLGGCHLRHSSMIPKSCRLFG